MDKMFIRKDVYEELLEKGFGKKDYSKLTKKVITDKNGHRRTVFVKNGEQPTETKQPKAQEGLTPEKKAKYEEMLEKVKAGSDENALFVRGEMLNKKDAIDYLENKLGKKPVSSAAEGHLESDTPQNTDITKEDEERFGKQALSGLSGKRTAKPTQDDMKENYLDAKNDGGKDISEENTINTLSKTIEFTPEETNAIQSAADSIGYKPGKEGALINELSKINKDIYHNLLEKNQKTWDKSGKRPKTFSGFDLILEKIKSMNIKANSVSNKFANMSGKDIVSNHISDLPMGRSVNTKSDLLNNIKSELNYLDYLKQNGSVAFNENKYNLLTAAKNNIDEVSKELKLEDK